MTHNSRSRTRPTFITAEKGGVAKAKCEGEKEKECITECKSRRRRDEKAPWALHYESGEGEGDWVLLQLKKVMRKGGGLLFDYYFTAPTLLFKFLMVYKSRRLDAEQLKGGSYVTSPAWSRI